MNTNSNIDVRLSEHTNGNPRSLNLSVLISYVKNLSAANASIDIPELSTISPNNDVVEGRITGIHASLEIANRNHTVFLVDSTSTIGRHLAILTKPSLL